MCEKIRQVKSVTTIILTGHGVAEQLTSPSAYVVNIAMRHIKIFLLGRNPIRYEGTIYYIRLFTLILIKGKNKYVSASGIVVDFIVTWVFVFTAYSMGRYVKLTLNTLYEYVIC